MGSRRTRTLVIGLLLGTVLLASAPAFAQDPFAGLTNMLNSHTRNFLFGAVFLVLAGAGLAIYDRIAGIIR